MAGLTRGPQVGKRAKPRELLQPEPPPELCLSPRATEVYRSLAERLRIEGYTCQADARTVGLAASATALLERLEAEVSALPTLLMLTASGSRAHPLLTEARAVRAQVATLYDRLFLSPKARSSSRLTEEQMRQAHLQVFDGLAGVIEQAGALPIAPRPRSRTRKQG